MSSPEPQPVTLYNTVGDVVPVVTDDQGNMRALAPNGRLVVAAGQIIASAWGNTTYDQSMMTFANAADRTNQWPVPNEGSLSFLMDSRTPWIFRQGAWRGLPLGYMGNVIGPAQQTTYGGAAANLVTLTVPVATGRYYRVSAYMTGTMGSAAGAVRVGVGDDQGGMTWVWWDALTALTPANAGRTGSAVYLFSPTSTRNAWFGLQWQGTGSFTVAANNAALLVEEIGG